MFIKVHLDFVHEFQVQLKGVVPKNKGHTNFYEHCDLRKEYIYAEILVFWRRSWSSNWLLGVLIDFHWLQLTLLNPHDSLQVKWIAKIFQNFCQKFFQFTFSLQLTLLNCTWSGPKWVIIRKKFLNLWLVNIFLDLLKTCTLYIMPYNKKISSYGLVN